MQMNARNIPASKNAPCSGNRVSVFVHTVNHFALFCAFRRNVPCQLDPTRALHISFCSRHPSVTFPVLSLSSRLSAVVGVYWIGISPNPRGWTHSFLCGVSLNTAISLANKCASPPHTTMNAVATCIEGFRSSARQITSMLCPQSTVDLVWRMSDVRMSSHAYAMRKEELHL